MAAGAVLIVLVLGSSLALAQPQVEIEFISSFGGYGQSQAGKFDAPVGVVIDAQGRLLIPDNGNGRVQRCDAQGDCEIFGSQGSQLGQFVWPSGVAEDSLGRIIVSDLGNDRIQLRDSTGHWTSFGSTGLEGPPGTFNLPAGIVVDGQDRIIIADENNHRVQICQANGSCTIFGSKGSGLGQFGRPRAVTLNNQQQILVSEWDNDRIQTCDYAGNCTGAFGSHGTAPGQFRFPCELAVDSRDHIIVTDRDNNRIQICDISGACTAYGAFGYGPGEFRSPVGVAVDAQNRIYVADRDNNRIQIFQATFADDPAPFLINGGLNDAWTNPETPGQGFFITVFPDIAKIFLAWFTYDTERPPQDVTSLLGDPGHRWLTAFGSYADNQAVLDIEVTQGGVFDAPNPATTQDLNGTIILEFSDCNAGAVSYDITSIDRQGVIPIERIALDNVLLCESLEAQLQQALE